MRTFALHAPSFLGGLALGAGTCAVARFAAGALRRRRAGSNDRLLIDGAKPADPAALDARPLPEPPREPLASESVDVDPQSQRW